MEDELEDVTMNRAPKLKAHIENEVRRSAVDKITDAPAPEVDNVITQVPRTELMSKLPPERKDKRGWVPPGA